MGDRTRLSLITRTVKVVDYVSQPAWRTRTELAEHLGVCTRTAKRWVQSLESAGIPMEFTIDGGRFRRMR